ncbi:hypothetical protein L207DRAFT_523989 [Hyaloscypha variabilis F]|uniref:Uncharacterized protein n=1 Tax=Hyaloscypha variabilis (strain UAMH 11265 / GT02V1 / F) TaxID=1149755 RepID=A0A2J6S782_HYAVF|nr:hypothetical protein L207DRAFT_523989 [Hyaloscypha variabilis F]
MWSLENPVIKQFKLQKRPGSLTTCYFNSLGVSFSGLRNTNGSKAFFDAKQVLFLLPRATPIKTATVAEQKHHQDNRRSNIGLRQQISQRLRARTIAEKSYFDYTLMNSPLFTTNDQASISSGPIKDLKAPMDTLISNLTCSRHPTSVRLDRVWVFGYRSEPADVISHIVQTEGTDQWIYETLLTALTCCNRGGLWRWCATAT